MPPEKPFATDGCSGGMSAAWKAIFKKDPPWEGCCKEHDRKYWEGGTAEQRQQADKELADCVRKSGNGGWAVLMYLGVRIGGHPIMPLPWRWGYGSRYSGKYDK